MSDYLLVGAVTNALNMPSVSAEEAPKLQPYMKLAGELGSFAGQLVESGPKKINIEYEGHVATLNTRPLSAVALQGLLQPLLESVNMVNAPVIARERNIDVAEITHDRAGDYHTLIRITVVDGGAERVVAGTLFGDRRPRLIQIDDIKVEAELGPHMLFLENEDKPGFIGRLGSVLGTAGINIATFHLGRTAPGGKAIALVEVDGPIPDKVLAEVRTLPMVRRAAALDF